jgi:hypothetical protein
MSADSVPSSKTNIFQNKLIYCRHFRTYSRCAMFDWSDTVFRRRNVTRRRISNTVLQPRYWGREADSPEVCRLRWILVEGSVRTGVWTISYHCHFVPYYTISYHKIAISYHNQKPFRTICFLHHNHFVPYVILLSSHFGNRIILWPFRTIWK